MISEVYNIDCVEYMKTLPDKYFDLAIVDPPYGIDMGNDSRFGKVFKDNTRPNAKPIMSKNYKKSDWDKTAPEIIYFNELRRVSKNQIIWGANHFISKIPFDSSCWLVWDKKNGDSNLSDCELAFTSFNTAVRKFEWLWNGFQKQRPEERIHPTQKPKALYRWILQNYAKPGDKIFDSHMGSQSSRLAAWDMGFDYWGCELDTDYFQQGCKRFDDFRKQLKLI